MKDNMTQGYSSYFLRVSSKQLKLMYYVVACRPIAK